MVRLAHSVEPLWQGWREPNPRNGVSRRRELAKAAEPATGEVATGTDAELEHAVGASILTDAAPDSTGYQVTAVPADLQAAVDRPLTVAEAAAVYSGDFATARSHFEGLAAQGPRAITAQDRAIHSLCRLDRLLDLVRRFTVFDGGIRKIARHQQYFAVRRAMERVKHVGPDARRQGGVVWHTQGSGKSLTSSRPFMLVSTTLSGP